MVFDGLIVVGLLIVLANVKEGGFDPVYRVQAILVVLLMSIFYSYFGVYHFYTNSVRAAVRLTKGWTTVLFSLLLIGFVTKSTGLYSREVSMWWMLGSYLLQLLAHLTTPLLLHKANLSQHRLKTPALIVGAGRLGRYLAERINGNPWFNVNVVGVVDDDQTALKEWNLAGVQALGSTGDIGRLVDTHDIQSAYIALSLGASTDIPRICSDLMEKHVNILWAPDVYSLNPLNLSVRELAGVPLVALSETPLLGTHKLLKLAEDKLLACLALLVLSPVMLLIALLIKLESAGPVLFKQRRHGWDGRVIHVWKFRSMYVSHGAEQSVKQATRYDARVTRVGRILRRTSADELPQLINVLRGTMSLVGPRPHAIEHNEYYSDKIEWYVTRHRIKPGMTGLAQVQGFRGETESLEKMASRVEWDLKYINNWSIWLDLWILVRTVPTLFSKSAY